MNLTQCEVSLQKGARLIVDQRFVRGRIFNFVFEILIVLKAILSHEENRMATVCHNEIRRIKRGPAQSLLYAGPLYYPDSSHDLLYRVLPKAPLGLYLLRSGCDTDEPGLA